MLPDSSPIEMESSSVTAHDPFAPIFGSGRGVPFILSDAPHWERYPFGREGELAERRLRFLAWILGEYGYDNVPRGKLFENAWKQRASIGLSASTKKRFLEDREEDFCFFIGGGFATSGRTFNKHRQRTGDFYQIREKEEWLERGLEAFENYTAEISE